MNAGRSSRRLARVPGLSADLHAAVRQSGLAKCSDLLTLTTLELVDRLDLYLEEVEDVLEAVAAAVAPQPRTALQLLQSKAAGPRPLRTGLPALDAHLGGGLRAGGVTEVVGPAGMGKTQLCLALAARALVDGSGSAARVLYVDNERSFQPARLVQLLRMLVSHGAPAVDPEELAARVCVVQPASWEEYEHCLPTLETEMLQQPASLIVVDSIAAPARAHFGRDRLMQRQDALAAQAGHRHVHACTPMHMRMMNMHMRTRMHMHVHPRARGSGGLPQVLGGGVQRRGACGQPGHGRRRSGRQRLGQRCLAGAGRGRLGAQRVPGEHVGALRQHPARLAVR